MRGFQKLPEFIHGDRRSRQRLSVRLPIEFRTESQSGTGLALDMSHDGIAFTASGRLRAGERFTATITLPVEGGIRPAKLVLRCEMVREDAGITAARIVSRSFEAAESRIGMAAGAGGATR